MRQNSNAILTLCSHLCVGEGISPLQPKEWNDLAYLLMANNIQPGDLFDFSPEQLQEKLGISRPAALRVRRLLDRDASLSFTLSQYENMGIFALTRADQRYPAKLKSRLGNSCPPVFYYAGALELLEKDTVGYVGSRTVGEDDIRFTQKTVEKTLSNGYGVVSGGAGGVDSIAEETALRRDGIAIAYLSDSMLRKIKSSETVRAIQNKRLLLLSAVTPDAGFQVGTAMMRNRYIYAQSRVTVVVRSDLNKGGTWAGAAENLKHNWCPTLCRNKEGYAGNRALIRAGALAIDENWDGNPDSLPRTSREICQQISMFDVFSY